MKIIVLILSVIPLILSFDKNYPFSRKYYNNYLKRLENEKLKEKNKNSKVYPLSQIYHKQYIERLNNRDRFNLLRDYNNNNNSNYYYNIGSNNHNIYNEFNDDEEDIAYNNN